MGQGAPLVMVINECPQRRTRWCLKQFRYLNMYPITNGLYHTAQVNVNFEVMNTPGKHPWTLVVLARMAIIYPGYNFHTFV